MVVEYSHDNDTDMFQVKTHIRPRCSSLKVASNLEFAFSLSFIFNRHTIGNRVAFKNKNTDFVVYLWKLTFPLESCAPPAGACDPHVLCSVCGINVNVQQGADERREG